MQDSLCGCYWDHEPQTEVELLRRGFHIAFVTPDPGKQWDAWYAWLTEKHGLSKKPAFVGMSKGGVNEYDWTTANPDKVSCIYADNPAIRPEAGVPLIHLCDKTDPWFDEHTRIVEQRYKELGGQMTIVTSANDARAPLASSDRNRVVDFIVGKTK